VAQEIKFKDKAYPQLLTQLSPAPNLYFKGDWNQQIFQHCLAVVGSRRMTDYGQEMVERLIMPVAQAGITIVSGFMYGIDAAAHQVCLEVGGRTIAVLGCGIEIIRPTQHRDLYQKIIDNHGLIISELPADHPAFRWTFVKRNRIVAGLCQATLVVEASIDSGALITADWALKLKRQVLAVPGPLTSKVSQGTAELIKAGAQLVTDPVEILKIYGFTSTAEAKASKPDLIGLEKQIFNLLDNQRLSTDEISRELSQPAGQIGTTLSLMILKAILKQDNQGRYYVGHG